MVYAAGDFTTGSGLYPCYWLNGQLVPLSSEGNQGSALSIVVVDPNQP